MAFFRSRSKLRLLATAAPLGLLALTAMPAAAQTTPAPAANDQAAGNDIVITGTLFKSVDPEASYQIQPYNQVQAGNGILGRYFKMGAKVAF